MRVRGRVRVRVRVTVTLPTSSSVPPLQRPQLCGNTEAGADTANVVVAEEPPPVLVLGAVVLAALKHLRATLGAALLGVLLLEEALLALPAGLVLVAPEGDGLLLLLGTASRLQLALLLAPGADHAPCRLLAPGHKEYFTVLYCNTQYCSELYCNILNCTVIHSTVVH